MSRCRALVAALALVIPACISSFEPVSSDSSIFVGNATIGTLDVWIDGRPWVVGLSINGLSYSLAIPTGTHELRLGAGGVAPATVLTVDTRRDTALTVVAYPSGSAATAGPRTAVLVDTGAFAPVGKSKLRVANLAANAGVIDIRRSQPDYPAGSPIMTPFAYGAVSPYLQSDAGVWEVWIAAPGGASKTASSGPIEIPSGERRTVLVLDSPVGPRFVVLAE